MSEERDNSGTVSANPKKTQTNQPDIKGRAMIGGVKYWVDGWKKETDGRPWYSLAFKRRDAAAITQAGPSRGGGIPGIEEDIPF